MDEKKIERIANSIVKIERIARSIVAEGGIKGWCQNVSDPTGYLLYCEAFLGRSEQLDNEAKVDGAYAVIEDELVRKYNAYALPEGASVKCLQKAGENVYVTFEFAGLSAKDVDMLVKKLGIKLERDDRTPEERGVYFEEGF